MAEQNKFKQVAALYEAENAMARHCYHHACGTHRDELEEIWHSDPSRHHWKMMKSVMTSYVEGQENSAKAGYVRRLKTHPMAALLCHDYRYLEEISVHVLSIPVLKASDDGTAVRAFWFTPGFVSPTLPDDVYRFIDCPMWMWERYTVDFDLDADGHYKICNFNNLMDTRFPMDRLGWTDYETRAETLRPRGPAPGGGPGGGPGDAPGGPPQGGAPEAAPGGPGGTTTDFMNVPMLPVEAFENFAALR